MALLTVALALAVGMASAVLEVPADEAPALASWPMWAAEPGRSFRLDIPGHARSLDYRPWHFADGGYQLGTGTEFVQSVTGDLDGDGDEEIVTASMPWSFNNTLGKLRVWSAEGRLLWLMDLLPPAASPVLYDWNMDGLMDVQITHGRLNQVFSGDGNLLWSIPGGPRPCGVHCAMPMTKDLTGDSVPEVVLRSGSLENSVFALEGRTLRVLWEHGLRCGFAPGETIAVKTHTPPRVVAGCRPAQGDEPLVEGPMLVGLDTRRAIAVEAGGRSDGLFEASKAWTWDTNLAFGQSTADFPHVVAGDVDGDSSEEVVVTTTGPHALHILSQEGNHLASWVEEPAAEGPSLALAQLDADPALEILESTDGRVSAYDYEGTQLSRRWVTRLDNSTALAVADLDGDGRDEVVVPVQVGRWCQYEANGYVAILDADGNLRWRSEDTSRCVQPVWGIALADLDKDGDIEIIQPAMSEFLVWGIGPQPGHT